MTKERVYRVRVRVQFEIEVDFDKADIDGDCGPDGWPSAEEKLAFLIEENGCPGTGSVGSAIRDMVSDYDGIGVCWACANNGESKILSVRDVEIEKTADGEVFFEASKDVN